MSLHYDGHTPPAGTPLLQIALFLADDLPVFPCNAAKRPITSNGLHDASQDRDTVSEMFSRPKAALIGVPTGRRSGVFAVDIDVRDGAKGGEWLAANEHRLPQTRRHRTQSGGTHLLFAMPAGRAIRNSAGKLAENVDVRGDGGYIIYPPSAGYSVSDPAAPAEAPDWLLDLLDPPQPAAAPAPKPRALADDTNGSRYAMAALDNACSAILSAGWGSQETTLNNMALHMGHFVAGGELSKGYAREALISAGMGMRNQPGMAPWHERDIRAKVERAMADGEARPWNAPPREVRHVHRIEIVAPEPPPYEDVPHHWHGEPDYDMSLDAAERIAPNAPNADAWTPLSLDEIASMPPPEWLVHKILPIGSFATLIGPYASLKSFLALDLALCVAYGQPWKGRDTKATGVLYVAGEGVGGIGRRIQAWRHHHGVEDQQAPFWLLPIGVNITDEAQVQRLVRTILKTAADAGTPIGLVIIDTLARAMIGADENTAQDMGRAVAAIDEIRSSASVTTLTVHHMGKDKERGARGSSALPAAADTEITVAREGGTLTVTVTKQKEDDEGEPIILQALKVSVRGGEPVEGEPTSLVLVDDGGAQSPGGAQSSRSAERLTGRNKQAYKVLVDLLAEKGEPNFPGVPYGIRSVPDTWWRDRFYDRTMPAEPQGTKQKAFKRSSDDLVQQGVVGMNRGRVWAV